MGRDQSPIGPAGEARNPPPSVLPSLSGSAGSCPLFLRPLPLFQRSLAPSRALAELERSTVGDQEEAALVDSVADMTEAEIVTLVRALGVSRHAALHDPLTGLANRSLILDHLELALARAGRGATLAAVIFFDLDNFKAVNDTLGHGAGDEVLVGVAERLGPTLRPADTLGRWGGDEFIVVCEDLERVSDATAIVGRIAAAFEIPFAVAGRELHVAASIGVAISAGTDQPAALIGAADSAMYRAKQDRPRQQMGPKPPAREAGTRLAKQERLTRRLHEVLSSLEVDDPPADQEGRAEAC